MPLSATNSLYILYLDESGIHAEAQTFALGGLAVFEREVHWFAQDLDALQKRYFPQLDDAVEFHVAKIRAPEGSIPAPFDSIPKEQRRQLITDVYQIIRESVSPLVESRAAVR